MEEHQEELATIESIDSGAVYTLALKTHIGMSVQTFRYFAGWCDKIQASEYIKEIINGGASLHFFFVVVLLKQCQKVEKGKVTEESKIKAKLGFYLEWVCPSILKKIPAGEYGFRMWLRNQLRCHSGYTCLVSS